jgi:hypothetical protein
MKKPPSKHAHNRLRPLFFSTANRPKSSPNLNSCSIKISHCGTSLNDFVCYIQILPDWSRAEIECKVNVAMMKRLFNQPDKDDNWSQKQQTKMHVTRQRFGDLSLFGLIGQFSSNHKTCNKGRFKVISVLTCSSNKLWAYLLYYMFCD